MKTELRTKRLCLRRTQPSDFDAMLDLVSDFDVVRNTATWPHPADPVLTRDRCTPSDPEMGMIGVVTRANTVIGCMGLARQPGEDPQLGYMFSRDHWGQGYATEMAQALIDHCWARYDWVHVRADVFADNPASARVLQKLGFSELPLSTGHSVARGQDAPLRNFQLFRPQDGA